MCKEIHSKDFASHIILWPRISSQFGAPANTDVMAHKAVTSRKMLRCKGLMKLLNFHFVYMLIRYSSSEASPTFGHANALFCVYRPCKELISQEMKNDND